MMSGAKTIADAQADLGQGLAPVLEGFISNEIDLAAVRPVAPDIKLARIKRLQPLYDQARRDFWRLGQRVSVDQVRTWYLSRRVGYGTRRVATAGKRQRDEGHRHDGWE